jgi:ABC-type branched-subunit amino acid transport system substrate-binding protein
MRERGIKDEVFTFVYDANDYGRAAYEALLRSKEEFGHKEIIGIPVEAGTADFSAQISQIKSRPDIEYITPAITMNDAILLLRQLSQYNVPLPMFAGGAGFVQGGFIEEAGELAEYVFSTSMYLADCTRVTWDPELSMSIAAQYKKDLGWELDEQASCAWMAMWVLWDALERSGSGDREAIVKALKDTDIKGKHMATLLSTAQAIKFEDKDILNNGVMLYNQNFDCQSVWGVVRDGAYRVFYPERYEDPKYPFVWPVPSFEERAKK